MGTPDLAVRRPPGHSTVLPFEERTWKATSTTTPTPALRPPRARAVEEAPGGPFFRKEVIIHLLSEFDSFECAKALAHWRGHITCSAPSQDLIAVQALTSGMARAHASGLCTYPKPRPCPLLRVGKAENKDDELSFFVPAVHNDAPEQRSPFSSSLLASDIFSASRRTSVHRSWHLLQGRSRRTEQGDDRGKQPRSLDTCGE